MPRLAQIRLYCLIGLLAVGQTGCNMVPQGTLRQSQLRTRQLYSQNKSLAVERNQSNQTLQSLQAEKQRLQSNLNIANQRLDNLSNERAQLQQRYVSLLDKNRKSPLDDRTTQRFKDLDTKYPDFHFDPQTGVSRFHSDLLFDSGSAAMKSSATGILTSFAQIMNDGDAKRLNILVVGHTDDRPIGKGSTRAKHQTNWHLSTNRANSVVLSLSKFGIQDNRMGAAGYSKYQPVVPNKDDKSRQQNRRVEIFVLAPDAVVAGWEPESSRK